MQAVKNGGLRSSWAMSDHRSMQLTACCVNIQRYRAGCNMQSRQIKQAVGVVGGMTPTGLVL